MIMENHEDKLYWYKATCVRVVDGDTLDLEIDLGLNIFSRQRVRLYGIDTPETYGVKKGSEEYEAGKKAAARVSEYIYNADLWIKTIEDKTGKYGRYLAEIYKIDAEGNLFCLNDILVNEGLAVRKTY